MICTELHMRRSTGSILIAMKLNAKENVAFIPFCYFKFYTKCLWCCGKMVKSLNVTYHEKKKQQMLMP
jgi:hypothetical protein